MPRFLMYARTLAVIAPIALHAQAPQTLAPATGRLTDSIHPVSSLSELSDGRIIFANGRAVVVADWKSGKLTPIDGVPTGRVFQLGRDTTLITNGQSGWIFLHGTTLLGGLSPDNPVVSHAGFVQGTDTLGFAVSLDAQTARDSIGVRVVSRRDGSAAQITALLSVGVAAGTPAPVYQAHERAALAPDGWLAVLRLSPYRVDWRTPDGKWIQGDSIPVPLVVMDQRQKEIYMHHDDAFGQTTRPVTDIEHWPALVEPVSQYSALYVTPDHHVLVLRETTADHPTPLYDVIDRTGKRIRSIELAQGETIVAFGAHSVYVQSGTIHHLTLTRHPWGMM